MTDYFINPPAAWLAEHCEVSERTVRRWLASGQLPKPAQLLVSLLYNGDLGAVFPEWRGWTVTGETLRYEPSGLELTAGQLHGVSWYDRTLKHMRRDMDAQRDNPIGLTASQQQAVLRACDEIDALKDALSGTRSLLSGLADKADHVRQA